MELGRDLQASEVPGGRQLWLQVRAAWLVLERRALRAAWSEQQLLVES